MSYLRPAGRKRKRMRGCLEYYTLKKLIRWFHGRGDTRDSVAVRLVNAWRLENFAYWLLFYFSLSLYFSEISAESAIYIQTFAKYFPLSSPADPIFRAISRVGRRKKSGETQDKGRKKERKKFANAFTQLRFLRYYNFFSRHSRGENSLTLFHNSSSPVSVCKFRVVFALCEINVKL